MRYNIDKRGLKELGLPKKFSDFRPHQLDAISEIVYHSGPVLIQEAPTGIGKSFIYVVASKLTGLRSVILTSTKGLQDQLIKDFGSAGMVEVRGRSNYRCEVTGHSASLGPCRWGMRCALKHRGCTYYDAIRRANSSSLVVTNYAYWLSSELLETPDMLVLDEAHSAFDHLASCLTATVDKGLLMWYIDGEQRPDLTDRRSALATLVKVEAKLHEEGSNILENGGDLKSLGPLSQLCENLRTLVKVLDHECVAEEDKRKLTVTPVKPPSDRLLRAPYSVLTSATVGAGVVDLLDLKEYKLSQYPSSFPKANRMIYSIKGVNVDHRSTDDDTRAWAVLIDQVLRSRGSYKGLIHTVSYQRRKDYMGLTREKKRIISPEPKELTMAVSRFRAETKPVVLASPAISTGYDFPDDDCRFQVIAKVPFPDAASKLQQRRSLVLPTYPYHYAWQQIVQASGRGVRSPEDWCDTIIIDNHFRWLHDKYSHLAPAWFTEAIKIQNTIPRRR